MSKTELEEDLRATLQRAALSVPLAPDLMSRASTGGRRQQRRTGVALTAAALITLAIASIGLVTRADGPDAAPAPATSAQNSVAPRTSTAPVLNVQAVVGTWRPVEFSGFSGLAAARPEQPVLTFTSRGTWSGSDGCNSLSGSYTISADGSFTSAANGQRLVGCANVPHAGILAAATKVSADASALRLFDRDGRRLAVYARTR